jgi:hypothetical protein
MNYDPNSRQETPEEKISRLVRERQQQEAEIARNREKEMWRKEIEAKETILTT